MYTCVLTAHHQTFFRKGSKGPFSWSDHLQRKHTLSVTTSRHAHRHSISITGVLLKLRAHIHIKTEYSYH